MVKARKKHVVVEVFHLTDLSYGLAIQLSKFMDQPLEMTENGIVIKTLEGDILAKEGDYIIKGVQGEFYPCKPDIFEQTYEIVEE